MKEKKITTRRQKTLRRLPVLLLLLFIYVGLGGYGLLPTQAIRYSEERANTGPTAVIRELGQLPIPNTGINQAYLCANDGAMLIALCRFHLLSGWTDYGHTAMDCSDPAPIHVGSYSVYKNPDTVPGNRAEYLYGRVDASAGALIRAQIGYMGPGEEWICVETVDIPSADWFETDGGRWFIQPLPRELWEQADDPLSIRALLLDSQGTVLYDEPVVVQGGTVLG